MAGGEPFAGGFRLVDAGLEEDAYLGALGEVEVTSGVAFEGGADTFRELLLGLDDDVAETLSEALIGVTLFFF